MRKQGESHESGKNVTEVLEDDHESIEDVHELLAGEGRGDEDDLLIGLQEVVGRPSTWRDPAVPIKPEEYVATITLRVACLSIDRRPNNQGIELSVTAEDICIENEMGSSGFRSQEPAKVTKHFVCEW